MSKSIIHRISDENRGNFTIIPNLIDDSNLSLIAFRLYIHFKRVAGESGECFQSTETLGKSCHISMGAVSKGKKELQTAKLIEIEIKHTDRNIYHNIKIIDIWDLNNQKYYTPSPDETPSLSEELPSPGEELPSPGETIKIPFNKIPINKKSTAKNAVPRPENQALQPSRQQAMIGLLARLCGLDYKIKSNAGRLAKRAAELLKADYTVEFVEQHFSPGGWWYENDWRGQRGNQPTPEQIIAAVGQIKAGPAMDESEVIYFYDQNGQREWFKNGVCFKTEPIPTGAEI